MMKKKIIIILGTRPEAIKMAPLYLKLKNDQSFDCKLCTTGQHKEMLYQVLDTFGITPDMDMSLMQKNQTLSQLTSRILESIDSYLKEEHPDLILIQGDTTTVLGAALAAFYNKIAIGHVEAGLRTNNLYSPWPEEGNRVLTSRLANYHFCPTGQNKSALLREGIEESKIFITGNTVIDALLLAKDKVVAQCPKISGLPGDGLEYLGNHDMVLITGHRRENFGIGFENICKAIGTLALRFPDTDFIYPVHLNPNVKEPVERILNPALYQNIKLITPQPYLSFLALMMRAKIILTDSGGVQEEAPSLGKPVLVMRDTTERPEAVEAGTVKLVGTEAQTIINEAVRLLTDSASYREMTGVHNPYGDGMAAQRIIDILKDQLL